MERLAYWVLCKYLSPYVSNLNPDALKLSLWDGTIKLQNLFLRPEALTKELNLPLTIIAGVLGNLTINVKWRSLKTSPIVVEIDEVSLLAAPAEDKPYDPELEKKLEKELKRKLLEEYAATLETDKSSGADDLFSSKSVFLLINNLQLKIGRIHIRYEDDGSSSGKAPFAAGITLTRLTALSADEGGRVTEKPSDSKTTARKALNMDSLALYWDTRTSPADMLRSRTVDEIRANLVGFFGSAKPKCYEYLIDPIMATGRIRINKKIADSTGATPPQIEIDLDFQSLFVVLSQPQYHSLLHTVDYLSWVALRHSFRHLRPTSSIKSLHGSAKEWWRYAFNAVLIDFRRRRNPWSWSFLKKRRDQRLAYVAHYTKILQAHKSSKSDEKTLEEMEDALGATEIILYRRIARSRLPSKQKALAGAAGATSTGKDATPKKESGGSSWRSWFKSSSSSSASSLSSAATPSSAAAAAPEPEPDDLGFDEAKKTFMALVDDSEDYETPTNAAYIATRVTATLDKFGAQLYSDSAVKDESSTVMKVLAEKTRILFTQRPAGNAYAFTLSMWRLGVWALTTSELRELLRPDTALQRTQNAFSLSFETNPIREGPIQPDMAVSVSLAPLETVFYATSFQRISEYFIAPEEVCLDDLRDAADSAIADVSEQARAGLEYAIENRKSVEINVDIKAPLVLVPQSDTDALTDSWLILDLGTFTLTSDLRPQTQDVVRRASLKALHDLIYDHYNLRVEGLQILAAQKKDPWRDCRGLPSSIFHILPKTEIKVALHRCLQEDDAQLPQFKVEATLPDLQANLSDRKLAHILKVAAMFQNAFADDGSSEVGGPVTMKALQRTNSIARPTDAFEVERTLIQTLEPLEEDSESASETTSLHGEILESESDGEEDEFFDADDGSKSLAKKPSTSRFKRTAKKVMAAKAFGSVTEEARAKRLRLAKRQVLVGKFAVHHLGVQMLMHEKDTEEPFLSVALFNFTLDLRQRTFDTHLDMSLDALSASGYIPSKAHSHVMEEHYYIHSVPMHREDPACLSKQDIKMALMMSMVPFITMDVKLCDKKSPLFRDEFKQTETHVAAKISNLCLVVDSEVVCPHFDALKRLIEAINRAQDEADALLAPELRRAAVAERAALEAAASADNAAGDGFLKKSASQSSGLNTPSGGAASAGSSDLITAKIDFQFENLYIDMISSKGRVAFFSLHGVSMAVTQKLATLEVLATLASIMIRDTTTKDTLYPIILSVKEGEDLLRVAYTGYQDPAAELPMVIKAETGNLRCVVLTRFIQEVMAFVEPVKLAATKAFGGESESGSPTSSSPASLPTSPLPAAKQEEKKDSTTDTPRFGIQVLIHAPTILFPLHSRANDLFVLDIGVLHAKNAYVEWSGCVMNQFEIQLNDFKLARAVRGESIQVVHEERPIMNWSKISAQVRQRILCRNPDDPENPFPLEVDCGIGESAIQLGRTDYAMLMRATQENLAEGGISIKAITSDNDSEISDFSIPSTPRVGDEDSLMDESISEVSLAQGLADLSTSERLALVKGQSKLNNPPSDPFSLQLTWRNLSLTLFNDQTASAELARHPDICLLRLELAHMSATYSLNPASYEEMCATIAIGSLHIEDKRRTERKNFFTTILHSKSYAGQETLSAKDIPVLDVRISQTRTSVLLVADDGFRFKDYKAKFNEAGRFLHLYEQISPPKGEAVAVLEFQSIEEATNALSLLREAKLPGMRRVDFGPSRSTTIVGSFNACKLRLAPSFGLDVKDFVDSIIASTESFGTEMAPDAKPRIKSEPSAVMSCWHCDAEHWSAEPEATDALSMILRVNHPQIVLVQDQFSESTRAIQLDLAVNLEYQQSENTKVATVDVQDLTLSSHQSDDPVNSRLEVIPATSANVMYRTVGEEVKVNVFTNGIDLNISYLDIKSIFKILETVTRVQEERQKEQERIKGTQACLWDQATVPAGVVKKIVESQSPSHDALAAREALNFNAKAINLTLLNSIGGRHSPLFVISLAAHAELSNWSSALSGTAGVELAAATLEPRQSAWEPFILADRSDEHGLGRPWELECVISTNTNTTVDPATIHVVRESGSYYKTLNIDGSSLMGGGAAYMLTGKNDFWYAKDHKRNWVIFDFGNIVKLQSMSYHTLRQPLHDPKLSILEVSESDRGPWRKVVEIRGAAGSGVARSPRFAESGRFWRWMILQRHSSRGACIRDIYFEKAAGGSSISVHARDRMEITLSSSGIGRLSKCISEWLSDYAEGRPEGESMKRRKNDSGQGTHRIHNMTGLRVAITPSNAYDPAVARKFSLASFESKAMTLRATKKTKQVDAEPLIIDSDEDIPIVDLAVICPTREEKAPPGFRVIRKNLNALKRNTVGTKSELFLCYRRGTDKPPITDIKIVYQNRSGLEGGKRGVEEPPPLGYERVGTDLNPNSGGRDTLLYVRRGNEAPIVAIAVTNLYTRETIPSGYVLIYKNINSGRPNSEFTAISIKRREAQISPSFNFQSHFSMYPISELDLVWCKSLKNEKKMHLLQGEPRGCDVKWEHLYHGQMYNINKENGGDDVILLHRRNPNLPPITDIRVVPQNSMFPGEEGWESFDVNLNAGTGSSERLYLQYRRDPGAPPIMHLDMFWGDKEKCPEGYYVVFSQLTYNAPGRPQWLCYRTGNLPPMALTYPEPRKGDLAAAPPVLSAPDPQEADQPAANQSGVLRALQLMSDKDSVHYIAIEVEGYLPIEMINIEEIGEQVHVLHRTWAPKDARVVVAINIENDMKVITLRSPLAVKNLLPIPVDICIQQRLQDETVLMSLEPGMEYIPPLGFMDSYTSEDLIPIFRFWSETEQVHFYSIEPLDVGEMATSFQMEYCMGFIFTKARPGTVPLWASRPTDTQGSRYHLTTNREKQVRIDHPNEKPRTDIELVQLGLRIVGHVYTEPREGAVPIYRYWNGMKYDILLTTEPDEVGVIDRRARGRHRYLFDGIECYVMEHPGYLRVRPSAQTHTWSHEIRNFFCSQSMPMQRFRSISLANASVSDPSSNSFHCDVSRPSPRHPTQLNLEAPLLIVNGLPCTIRAGVVTNPSDIPRDSFQVLKCREEMHVFDRDVEKDLFLRIMIAAPLEDGTLLPEWWSKPARIGSSNKQDFKSESFITMEWADPITKKQHILGLCLEFSNKYDSYGPRRINIYSPYLIHDKTTLGLQLMTTSSRSLGLYFPPKDEGDETSEDTPAIFAPMTGAESTIAYVGLQASEPFSLAAALDVTVVKTYTYTSEQNLGAEVPADQPATNQLVVSWVYSTLPGLSKVFTISSIMLVRNHTEWPLDWGSTRVGEGDPKTWVTLSPSQELPLNANLVDQVWKLRWRGVSDWSSACFVHDHLRSTSITHVLKMMRQSDGVLLSLQCESRLLRNRHIVTLLPPPPHAPIRVENRSSVDVSFSQKGSPRTYVLKANEKMNYAFDDPSLKNDILCFAVATPCRSQSESTCISLHPQTPSQHQYTLVSGAQKALAICMVYEPDTKTHVYFIADSLEQVRILYGLTARPPEEDLVWDLALQLPHGFGFSFVENASRRVQELAFLSLEGIDLTLAQTTRRLKMHVEMDTLQLDFQAYDAMYPVVIFKTPAPTPSQARPLLTMTYIQKYGMIGFERSVDSVEYISVLLMPLTAKVDGIFGASCIEFFQNLVLTSTEEAEREQEEEIFFQKIELHPVKVTITLTHVAPILEKASLFLRSIGATVLNLNNVNLQLASLIVPGDESANDKNGLLMTTSELLETIGKGYEARFFSFLKQVGIVSGIASLQIFGDPLNTLKTLAGGAKDFFYEPFQAVVRGPAEFGIGLGKGAKSLGSSLVGGVTGASSRITGAVGQGMAVMTMDDEYQLEREKNMRNRPQGLADGLAMGGKQFVKGMAAGVKGLVMQPIKDGQKGGFFGGLLGVAKGVTGLVTKPASGIMDLFSSTLAGIESEVLGGREAGVRVRKPRFIKPSGVIVPYDSQKADGEYWLKTNKTLSEDFGDLVYISHTIEEMPNKSFRIVFCLNKLVIVVVSNDLKNVKVTQKIDSSRITHCRQFAEAIEIGLDDSSTLQIPFSSPPFAVQLLENLTELINMNKPRRKIGNQSQCLFKLHTAHADAIAASKLNVQASLDSNKEMITERVEVWENERAYFGKWSKKLLPTDRGSWSNKDGTVNYNSLEEVKPYDKWEWASDWRVDMTGEVCDSEQFQYASNFPSAFTAKKGMFNNVRRRRWVRLQKGERRFHPVSSSSALPKMEPSSSHA